MSSPRVDPPVFLLVAGPNGSGKSSAYQETDIEAFGRSVWIINPDMLTARIRDVEGVELSAANLQAVQRIEAWLQASIGAHQTVGVENIERVRLRVKKGGHDVPEEKNIGALPTLCGATALVPGAGRPRMAVR